LLKALAQAIERQKRLSWQFAGAKRRSLRVMRAKAPCAGTGIAREKGHPSQSGPVFATAKFGK
jgi:hypothetical protein